MSRFWPETLADMPADRKYSIRSYGYAFQKNKQAIVSIADYAGATSNERAVIIAMAMIETTTLSADDRDRSKDTRTDGSANVSLFNLNVDLVLRLGYAGDTRWLNSQAALPTAVGLILKGLRRMGVVPFLNYVRGGYTAWKDGKSYDAYGYRNAIATMLRLIDEQPCLLYDDRRIDIDLKHV